jgi:hypothetical protein
MLFNHAVEIIEKDGAIDILVVQHANVGNNYNKK